MKMRLLFLLICCCQMAIGQNNGEVRAANIQQVQLFQQNDQFSYPVAMLGVPNSLELHFDDADNRIKNYFYTYQLCNADWQPVNLNAFDFIKGFVQNRISQYRQSSIAKARYIHYQAQLPDARSMPSLSGNYLLKVFVNGDTSQTVFTRKMLIINPQLQVGASIQQPFNPQQFRTHQKLVLSLDVTKLPLVNPRDQVKVVILQNYRWDNASTHAQPTFLRGSRWEYNAEQDLVFPAGREFRWVDLRSFRFQSERVDSVNMATEPFSVVVKPDAERQQSRYLFFEDRNGFFETASTDMVNPWWQGDYADVRFTFVPAGRQPLVGKDVFVAGQFSNYQYDGSTRMNYNAEQGVYEKTLRLKQGFYTYTYFSKPVAGGVATTEGTDGNYWETQNMYTVLVYYRSLSGRHDELVGMAEVNSRNSRVGM